MPRWVLHVDMDQFIAAVEVLRRPELAGLPVVVGGRGDPTERGVVATASYEAREFGVRSGMPLRTAAKRCPDAVFLAADREAYDAASAVVMRTLRAVPDTVVEVLGWDEAFVGVRSEHPEEVARERAGAGAGRSRAALLGGRRGHQGPRQDGHRVRQAARRLPAHPRQLARGHGRAAHAGTVGRGSPDPPAARRPRASRRCGSWPPATTSCSSPSSVPPTAPTSVDWAAARAAAEVDDTAWVPRAHGRESTYQEDLTEPAQVAAALAALAEQVVVDIAAEGRPCARVHLEGAVRPVLHREPVAQAARADVRRGGAGAHGR